MQILFLTQLEIGWWSGRQHCARPGVDSIGLPKVRLNNLFSVAATAVGRAGSVNPATVVLAHIGMRHRESAVPATPGDLRLVTRFVFTSATKRL